MKVTWQAWETWRLYYRGTNEQSRIIDTGNVNGNCPGEGPDRAEVTIVIDKALGLSTVAAVREQSHYLTTVANALWDRHACARYSYGGKGSAVI